MKGNAIEGLRIGCEGAPRETARSACAIDHAPPGQPIAPGIIQGPKMEALGQLAGGVAHDFNNLLTVLAGYCELVAEDPALGAGSAACVGEMRTTIEHARVLTQRILAFSRGELPEMRLVSVNQVVAGVVQLLERTLGAHVEIVTCLDQTLALVQADPHQLEQLLVNLALNARDAMPHGGVLTFSTINCALDPEYRRTHTYVKAGSYVRLTVADTGVGMDTVTLARAVEPFFTTKPPGEGTGLGLSTVYGVVKQSGGYLELESAVGHGTTVSILLPRAR